MDLSLKEALLIAVEAHGEQKDKQGEPYLWHVFRVAMAMDTDEERVVALLHDVLEGLGLLKSWGIQDLIVDEYGHRINNFVRLLTNEDGSTYENYIRHIALHKDPLPAKVKLADLRDNLREDRLSKLPLEESARLRKKYTEALEYLTSIQTRSNDERNVSTTE